MRANNQGGRGSDVGGVAVAAVIGVGAWTALEYGIHRVLGHELRGRGITSREHLAHHADVTYFSPAHLKALSACTTAAVAFPATAAVVGRRRAGAFTVGLVTMYVAYEVMHRRTHTHAPRGAYSRWTRRNHLHHHAGNPMRNFGVTTPLWDKVFGTYDPPPDRLRLGRRLAPEWLLDADYEVRPAYDADYEVVGPRRASAATVEADREAALGNRTPALDPVG
jgi:sterol desaturase/sphingolipid hydroxylase (fatty acid hydroxylase superfamily)